MLTPTWTVCSDLLCINVVRRQKYNLHSKQYTKFCELKTIFKIRKNSWFSRSFYFLKFAFDISIYGPARCADTDCLNLVVDSDLHLVQRHMVQLLFTVAREEHYNHWSSPNCGHNECFSVSCFWVETRTTDFNGEKHG